METAEAPLDAPLALAEAAAALLAVVLAEETFEVVIDDGLEDVEDDPARGAVDCPSICAWIAGENVPDMPFILGQFYQKTVNEKH
jgi:hypothetical protein